MSNNIDKLSQWLKDTVQGGSKSRPVVSANAGKQGEGKAPSSTKARTQKPRAKAPASKAGAKPGSKPGARPSAKPRAKASGQSGSRSPRSGASKGGRSTGAASRGHKSSGGGARGGSRGGSRDKGIQGRFGTPVQKKPVLASRVKGVQKGVMRIIPIGGLEEVGKNAMVVEYEDDILVIDLGFQFPEDDMLGVDYVIPDIQYLVERKNNIRGILITHGHLDHIGAIPFVLPDIGFPPIYGMPLSIGMVRKQVREHKMEKETILRTITNKDRYQFGKLEVEFFRVNHSIPDSIGIVIRSPEGTMVHTGDFKFDFTPADGIESDIGKMSAIGKQGVHIMFSDSTNATKPGHTMSERVVADNLERAISGTEGRIIIACFASLIGRIQQIIEFAQKEGRKVFLSGRSIEHNAELGQELGFIKAPKGLIKSVREVGDYKDSEILVLTTGSQGEPMAALSRMASNSHRNLQIRKGDTVVVSASPIIGNEKSVAFLVDNLTRLGAEVVHNRIMDVHTSGHGQQEDLKMMMSLIKPDHLVPVHGNYYMRKAHANLGPKVGIPMEHVHMMDNGNVIELRGGKVTFKHEDIGLRYVVVDGLGRGDLGSQVLKDREAMAQNGVAHVTVKMRKGKLVGKPVLVTRGFVYQKETLKVEMDIVKAVENTVQKLTRGAGQVTTDDIEQQIRSTVSGLIYRKLNRRPLISTMVLQV
jgi:ribonuclease J